MTQPPPNPCPEYAEACTLAAWGEPVDATAAAHLERCPRCRAALAASRAVADGAAALAPAPPPEAGAELTRRVLAATTRRAPAPARRSWAWGGAGAALAAAGLAGVVWWRGRPPADPAAPDFAEVDLELLEDLELAENLDLLVVLDALEEIDDA